MRNSDLCKVLQATLMGRTAQGQSRFRGNGAWSDRISICLVYYKAECPYSIHGILPPDEAYAFKTEPMRLAASMKT
ncbi:hypothetical protein [uncultured Pelagimonas sp.]|uniref:hypothetical protein n=1 Tax=uncultured Pelagimonas sp. TaxID=1618102 RepID=UPI00260AEBEB|nr:hypothetical protein [uncultured Pelagimonas sp.]